MVNNSIFNSQQFVRTHRCIKLFPNPINLHLNTRNMTNSHATDKTSLVGNFDTISKGTQENKAVIGWLWSIWWLDSMSTEAGVKVYLGNWMGSKQTGNPSCEKYSLLSTPYSKFIDHWIEAYLDWTNKTVL